jgi:hypothetical protein
VFRLAGNFLKLVQLPLIAVADVAVAERQDLIKLGANQGSGSALSSVLLAPNICASLLGFLQLPYQDLHPIEGPEDGFIIHW